MKKFMTPEVEVLKFAVVDVITTSEEPLPPSETAELYCI